MSSPHTLERLWCRRRVDTCWDRQQLCDLFLVPSHSLCTEYGCLHTVFEPLTYTYIGPDCIPSPPRSQQPSVYTYGRVSHSWSQVHLQEWSKSYQASHAAYSSLQITLVQATAVITGSHLWPSDRAPKVEECTYAEMEPGSALFTLGCAYPQSLI